jgi:Na+/H+ antiporter NhaD/arsenite permease-like protein
MAEFIAALVDPPVTIPTKLAALLDTTILLRQSFSDDVTEILADTADKASTHRHAFFLGILKNVRSILSPLLSSVPHW